MIITIVFEKFPFPFQYRKGTFLVFIIRKPHMSLIAAFFEKIKNIKKILTNEEISFEWVYYII